MTDNKTYDILKLIGQVVLPAFLACAISICDALGLDTSIIAQIGGALVTLYNAVIVIWNKQYKKALENDTQGYNL